MLIVGRDPRRFPYLSEQRARGIELDIGLSYTVTAFWFHGVMVTMRRYPGKSTCYRCIYSPVADALATLNGYLLRTLVESSYDAYK